MLIIKSFEFSPFLENTYVVSDDTKECIIIDPGCYTEEEKLELSRYIDEHNLLPVKLLNTHAHLDHIFGNKYTAEKYGLEVEIHEGELPILHAMPAYAQMYGLELEISPEPGHYIEEGDEIKFGHTTLTAILTPGHSPASLSFFCEAEKVVFSGDALFYDSIGRTDLPGGDYDLLIRSIKTKLLTLGDDIRVLPGHGISTIMGYERKNNGFLQ